MNNDFNYDKYAYFVLLPDKLRSANYSFRTYTDMESGMEVGIYDGRKDTRGEPVGRRFNFSRKERVIRIPKEQKDRQGNSIVDFLKNHPECVGSVNNRGQAFWFKLMDEEADAEVALERKKARIDAEKRAMELEEDEATLFDAAYLFGYFGDQKARALHAVSEVAHSDPQRFMEVLDAPDFKARALLAQALKKGLFEEKGNMIVWKNETIGADSDEAVSRILKEKKLADSIVTNLSKIKS